MRPFRNAQVVAPTDHQKKNLAWRKKDKGSLWGSWRLMDRVWPSGAFLPILGEIRVQNVSDLDFYSVYK